jgi:hypothetical protein
MPTPIVLFVYNRPWHTRKTLESLETNNLSKESELFIFADGPKENATQKQLEKIKETRNLIREKKWCGKVSIIERDKNMGLANSVITGVTEIINKFGKIIVLEDDLVLSKNFLRYMNESLEKYKDNEKIMQIAGYMYPIDIKIEEDAFFLSLISSWGWGTWKRVWDKFDESKNGFALLKKNAILQKKFDLGGSYPYFKMLKNQVRKNIDSWAIQFYLVVFMEEGLTLFPKKTLVNNIGMDGSGVHCKVKIAQSDIDNLFEINYYPSEVNASLLVQSELQLFLKKQMNIFRRIFRLAKQMVS